MNIFVICCYFHVPSFSIYYNRLYEKVNYIIVENSMEKGHEIDPYDTASNSSRSKKEDKNREKGSLLYDIDWFPITTSPWIASMSFFCNLLFIIHSIDFYSENARRVFY